MAIIAGQVVWSPDAGIVNPLITPALNQFGFAEWPRYRSQVEQLPVSAAVTTAYPVEANGREIAGQCARALSDDWYHRIFLFPRVLNLGNVVSTQIEEVLLWNAFLRPVHLVSIDGIAEGISISDGLIPPATLGPVDLRSWDVSVAPVGPAIIDLDLTWNFSDAVDVVLRVTGRRIIAWPFVPDWSQPIRETLSWFTDIPRSETNAQQRRALRLSPRRSFGARFLLEDRDRSYYDLLMHAWGGQAWALPIWPDVQRLPSTLSLGAMTITCDTRWRDFRVGGLALLRGETPFVYEAVEIDEISDTQLTLLRPTQRTWPAGTRLYPMRSAELADQPRNTRLTDRAVAVEAQFRVAEISDWPAIVPSITYRDHPVYAKRPDESENLTGTFERLLSLLDNSTGIPMLLDTAEAGFAIQAHRIVLEGRQARSDFRSLLYALRGMQVSMWIPTHADDLRLVADVGAAATALIVSNIEYSRFGLDQAGRRDIRIELRNGVSFHRRIVDAEAIDDDTERLVIDAALGQTVTPAQVARICFMTLSTLERDDVEIQHITDGEGVATSSFTWRGVRDDI